MKREGMINNLLGIRVSRKEMKKMVTKEIGNIFSGPYEILSAESLREVIGALIIRLRR